MNPFDEAWGLVKDQTPEFNPGLESEDGWMGNIPRNAEEAYIAASQNKPVYHCPACDAYTDNQRCYGQAYESFITTPNHLLNPTGHAYRHQSGGIAGVENTIPTWRMSARERYGIGYHPVPDPSSPPSGDGMDFLGDMVGTLESYNKLPAEKKPRLRDFIQRNKMDEARQQRIMYLYYLMEQSGLSQDELKSFLQAKPTFSGDDSDIGREQQELRDSYSDEYNGWMKDFWSEEF